MRLNLYLPLDLECVLIDFYLTTIRGGRNVGTLVCLFVFVIFNRAWSGSVLRWAPVCAMTMGGLSCGVVVGGTRMVWHSGLKPQSLTPYS